MKRHFLLFCLLKLLITWISIFAVEGTANALPQENQVDGNSSSTAKAISTNTSSNIASKPAVTVIAQTNSSYLCDESGLLPNSSVKLVDKVTLQNKNTICGNETKGINDSNTVVLAPRSRRIIYRYKHHKKKENKPAIEDMDNGCFKMFTSLGAKTCYKVYCKNDGVKFIIRSGLENILEKNIKKDEASRTECFTLMPKRKKAESCFRWKEIEWSKTSFKGCIHADLKYKDKNSNVEAHCVDLNCEDYDWKSIQIRNEIKKKEEEERKKRKIRKKKEEEKKKRKKEEEEKEKKKKEEEEKEKRKKEEEEKKRMAEERKIVSEDKKYPQYPARYPIYPPPQKPLYQPQYQPQPVYPQQWHPSQPVKPQKLHPSQPVNPPQQYNYPPAAHPQQRQPYQPVNPQLQNPPRPVIYPNKRQPPQPVNPQQRYPYHPVNQQQQHPQQPRHIVQNLQQQPQRTNYAPASKLQNPPVPQANPSQLTGGRLSG